MNTDTSIISDSAKKSQSTLKQKVRAALAYAERFGWAVIPLHSIHAGTCTCGKTDCTSPGKHPLVVHGVQDASNDPAIITAWWLRWPWANIGIATGAASKFFVLDVDMPEGPENLQTLEDKHGTLPDTVEAITGSGGRHILFTEPTPAVKNRVRFAPGLDTRSTGGYIVVAPSIHISGRNYQWEVSSRPGETALAPAPDWLLNMLKTQEGQSTGQNPEDWRQLVRAGVDQGQRNANVARLAGLLLRRYVDPYVTLDLCLAWNAQRCRPPLPEDEVGRTVDSVARTEARRRQGGVSRG